MTEVAIFAFGGVIFIVTTWATVAFGLRRIHELHREDLKDSPRIDEIVEETDFTEIYVTREVDETPADQQARTEPMPGLDRATA